MMKKKFIHSMDLAAAITKSVKEEFLTKAINDRVIPSDANGGDIIVQPYDIEALNALRYFSVTHRKCLKAKAVDITLNGWTPEPVEDEGSEDNKKRLNNIFNDYGSVDALRRMEEDNATYGFAAVQILRNDAGDVVGFKHIRSRTLFMCTGGKKALQRVPNNADQVYFKILGSTTQDLDYKSGTFEDAVPPEKKAAEILWVNGFGQDSDYYGEPEYISALTTIKSDDALREFNYNGFKSGRIPNYLIIITGNFEDDTAEDPETGEEYSPFEENMQDELAAVKNTPGSALVYMLPTTGVDGATINVEVIKLSDEITDASFEQMRLSNRDEILEAHEVPPQRLGINPTGALGGNLSLEINKQYNSKVIHPEQAQLENLLNKLVIQDLMEIEDWTIRANDLDVDDMQVRLTNAQILVQNAAMTPLELREQFSSVFNIDTTDNKINYPELDQFFFNGQPANGQPVSPQTEEILKSMQTRVMELITS